MFADNEGAYLAGIAAAMQSKTNKVGFIGGQTSDTITRFEAGFTAGAKSVKPDINVQVQYAESFSDAAKGTTIASTMYASGVDVICKLLVVLVLVSSQLLKMLTKNLMLTAIRKYG